MTEDKFRPVVAIEVEGLLLRTVRSEEPHFVTVTLRHDAFPTRFLTGPPWTPDGFGVRRYELLSNGVAWVRDLLEDGVEVVWASHYQQFAHTYFGAPLDFPELPVAAADDGLPYTTEAEWKARMLGAGPYATRPLLWVNNELTTSGRHLLERERRPAMRALTWTKFIPEDDSVSDGDIAFIDEWLELASSPEGHEELRRLRARFVGKRRRYKFSSDQLQEQWLEIRSRLDDVLDSRSGLAAPLAAYAIEHIGELDVQVVAQIREEWGLSADPPADTLLPLLEA